MSGLRKRDLGLLTIQGIHGIKARLERLGFISVAPECCSGHPVLKDAANYFDEGYINLQYEATSQKSKKFHDSLRDIVFESGEYSVFFTLTYSSKTIIDRLKFKKYGKEYYRPRELDDLAKGIAAEGKFIRKQVASERFDITVASKGGKYDPEEVAVALCGFWQNVSDLILGYEEVKVREALKPHYFGIRSIYGTIAVSHPAFSRYYDYKERSEIFGKHYEKPGYDTKDKVSGAPKRKISLRLAAAIAGISLYSFGLGFGIGWYIS